MLFISLVDTFHFCCKGFEIIIEYKVILNCEYYGIGEEVGATLRYVVELVSLWCGVDQPFLLQIFSSPKLISLGPVWTFSSFTTLHSVVY
jgi:hypothetical protein